MESNCNRDAMGTSPVGIDVASLERAHSHSFGFDTGDELTRRSETVEETPSESGCVVCESGCGIL